MSSLAIEAATQRIPSSWNRVRFKSIVSRREERRGEMDLPMLSLASAGHLFPRESATDRQRAAEGSLPRYLVAHDADLVINPMWLTGGSLAVSDLNGVVSPDYRVFEPSKRVEPRFLHHLLRSDPYRDQYNLYVRANTTFDRRIQQIDLDNMPIALPPIGDQRRIADFLDDQVARVDTVIAARRVQRKAVATHFQSSLETLLWAGAESMPLKYLVESVTSGPRGWGDLVSNTGLPFLRIANLSPLGIDLLLDGLVHVQAPEGAESDRASVQRGDVLLSITATMGSVAVVDSTMPGAFSQHVGRLRPLSRHDARWIAWTLQSKSLLEQYGTNAYGGGKVGLSLDQVRNLRVPRTTANHRQELSAAIDAEWHVTKLGLSTLHSSMALLAEYKQSLTTAAVTGELDVTTARKAIPA